MLDKTLIVHPDLGESMHSKVPVGITKQLHLYLNTLDLDSEVEVNVEDWEKLFEMEKYHVETIFDSFT
jgi:hypothetical protein